ncbi:MAG: hypothetical protein LBD30_07040 [Verrucomicrobiales bacterium]|jgi:tetratricopeptide (TPR) repeat protein|nr:hypothetical protein [Verrucomicrobiales bacterium]
MKFTLLALALLGAWGAGKIAWENRLLAERNVITVGDAPPMNYQLRDSLGQGLTMAALGGFRGLAADYLWLSLVTAWETQEWERVQTLAELCVLLQPRVAYYWEYGAWNLAWNASISAGSQLRPGRESRANHDAMRWIDAGRGLLERGVKIIPEKPVLYQKLGDLYWDRLKDYGKAAEWYREALRHPNYPKYLERSVGFALEKAGKKREAREYWRGLWDSVSEHPEQSQRRWDVVADHLEKLEAELSGRSAADKEVDH